ncbi:MAG: CapA family protein, partial [Victivallaceae bacterium]|nr:CapA family protein [Victivallaceae bacterium]
ESIKEDLNRLPEGAKAILYLHWGRDNVWCPPSYDIGLAKKLLEEEQVVLVIGMHSHYMQGYVEHKGKRAYMGIGDFLFPNFFIKPSCQIAYPHPLPEKYMITRNYHGVRQLTYKKWKIANRVSLILEFDTETHTFRHIPVMQDDNEPKVRELSGFPKLMASAWVLFLSYIYKLPAIIYNWLERSNSFVHNKLRQYRIFIFSIRQKEAVRK